MKAFISFFLLKFLFFLNIIMNTSQYFEYESVKLTNVASHLVLNDIYHISQTVRQIAKIITPLSSTTTSKNWITKSEIMLSVTASILIKKKLYIKCNWFTNTRFYTIDNTKIIMKSRIKMNYVKWFWLMVCCGV